MAEEFSRSEIDRHSMTWRAIVAWAEEGLAKDGEELEIRGLEPSETEALRGGIAKLRALLDLTRTDPPPIAQSNPYIDA